MKKTLIAIALTALPIVSMAEVTLYGKIKGGVEVSKVKNSGHTTSQIVDYGSRIGFKGKEQISDNMKAIWQVEQKVDIAGTKGRGFGTRDSFIGLETPAGTVKAGYFGNPVGNTAGTVDEWEYNSPAAGLGAYTGDSSITGRKVGVSYKSPEFYGLTATAFVAPSNNSKGGEETLSVHGQGAKDVATYALGLEYQNNGVFAAVAGGYQHTDAKRINAKGESKRVNPYHAVATIGYDANNVYAGVEYQQTRDANKEVGVDLTTGNTVTAARTQEVAATVAYTFDNALRVKGSVAQGLNLKHNDGNKVYGNGKYTQGVIGADYNLSKRTQLNAQVGYAQFGKNKDANGKQKANRLATVGVGLKHQF